VSDRPPPFLDPLRDKIRLRHYGIQTEEALADWVRRFVLNGGSPRWIATGAAKPV
jgi:hypothetical protein